MIIAHLQQLWLLLPFNPDPHTRNVDLYRTERRKEGREGREDYMKKEGKGRKERNEGMKEGRKERKKERKKGERKGGWRNHTALSVVVIDGHRPRVPRRVPFIYNGWNIRR